LITLGGTLNKWVKLYVQNAVHRLGNHDPGRDPPLRGTIQHNRVMHPDIRATQLRHVGTTGCGAVASAYCLRNIQRLLGWCG